MEQHYDEVLVAYSFVIATLTGYCGIEMTARVRAAAPHEKARWIVAGAIAFGTGVWALLIMTWLRTSNRWTHVALRLGAALVMAVAVTGMHYTGMAAAMFAPGAYCSPGNQLSDAWTILGLVMVATAVVSLSQWWALLK